MRGRVIAGLCIAAVTWPFAVQAQQSALPAFQDAYPRGHSPGRVYSNKHAD
jgi:hypothetical protein